MDWPIVSIIELSVFVFLVGLLTNNSLIETLTIYAAAIYYGAGLADYNSAWDTIPLWAWTVLGYIVMCVIFITVASRLAHLTRTWLCDFFSKKA